MFWHQKARAVPTPKGEGEKKSSSESDESNITIKDEIPKLDSLASMTKHQDMEKVFGNLIGYQVASQLDQKLIEGIISDHSKKKKKHESKIIM